MLNFDLINNKENSKVTAGISDRCDIYHVSMLIDEVHEKV
jgi:hypothetical protein